MCYQVCHSSHQLTMTSHSLNNRQWLILTADLTPCWIIWLLLYWIWPYTLLNHLASLILDLTLHPLLNHLASLILDLTLHHTESFGFSYIGFDLTPYWIIWLFLYWIWPYTLLNHVASVILELTLHPNSHDELLGSNQLILLSFLVGSKLYFTCTLTPFYNCNVTLPPIFCILKYVHIAWNPDFHPKNGTN